jgi:hypothetical protein
MKKYLLYFAIVFAYKLITNGIKYLKCKSFKFGYYQWLNGENDSFPTYRSEIISLFKCANIEDLCVPAATPLGFGQLATFKSSAFTNFPSKVYEQAVLTEKLFNDAIGVYRTRTIESFSPVYWINAIVFLPKNLLCYLGLKPENVIIKLLQLSWWLFGLLFGLFKDDVLNLIKLNIPIKLP